MLYYINIVLFLYDKDTKKIILPNFFRFFFEIIRI